ncbi:MAG: hypothetical protein ACLSFZ_00985 [Frisingicoccus sp.]
MTEYFELLDEEGNRIGKVKEREAVHRDGDLHGGSHIWVIRDVKPDGHFRCFFSVGVMIRILSGCLDVSSAGHMTQEKPLSTALRELEEELGIRTTEEHLQYLFKQLVGGDFVFMASP